MKHMENAHVEINLQKHAKAQGMPIVSHTQNKAINTHHLSAKGTKRIEWRDAPFAHVSAKWTNPRNTLHNSSLAWSVETHHMWWQGTAALSISLGTMHDNHFKSPEIPVLRADRVDLELFCRTSPPSPQKKTVPYAILFQMQRHDQTIHYPKQHHDPPEGTSATTLKPLVGKGLHQHAAKVHEKWSTNLLGTLLDLEPNKNITGLSCWRSQGHLIYLVLGQSKGGES